MLSSELHPSLLISMPGGSEWIVIILVVLLLFGGKKIPELMRGIGKGMREFNDIIVGSKEEMELLMNSRAVLEFDEDE